MRAASFALVLTALVATGACQSTSVRGEHDQEMTETTPMSLTMHRGETVALEVGIDRKNFSGPVTVSVSRLPKGVSVDRATQKTESQTATFALKASDGADLVANQKLDVTLDGMDGRRATQYVALTVKP